MTFHFTKLLARAFVIVGMLGLISCMQTDEPAVADDPVQQLSLADQGETAYVISLAEDASAPEKTAAEELAKYLGQVTGADFAVVAPDSVAARPAIAVGSGAARALEPALDLAIQSLGQEGILIRSIGFNLILTGAQDARRGALYAVYTFLEDVVGCRWWTPAASHIPRRPTLAVPPLDRREQPAFEYREALIAPAVDPSWAARNRVNGYHYIIPVQLGGRYVYRPGFVHTFNRLVPPDHYFPIHPEWFSEIDGRRVGPPERAQWCLTNAELLVFVTERVRDILRNASREDTIVEISQNDWHAHCRCAACLAVEQEEGSPSGALLRFINAVAQSIEAEFPNAVVSTLAYQQTRPLPKLTRPRPNVGIRLCSIESSFLQPLEDEVNHAFAEDLRQWAEVTDRLYVWDYVTNFRLPLQPHPNLRVLDKNLRLFAAHGVRGVFEEGSKTPGTPFSEIRAWVLAKLLWNPERDGNVLAREFVAGYYGPAAPFVQRYIDQLHDAAEATGHYMTCYDAESPFLTYPLLRSADHLLVQAFDALEGHPDEAELRQRTELVGLGIWDAIIRLWPRLRLTHKLEGKGEEWFERPRASYLHDFLRVCGDHGVGDWVLQRYGYTNLLARGEAEPPDLVKDLPATRWLDLQDELFQLFNRGTWVELIEDAAASDGIAARLSADHREWAIQCTLPLSAEAAKRKWAVYVAVRVERAGDGVEDGLAFTAGVYDVTNRRSAGRLNVSLRDAAPSAEYRLYRIDNAVLSPNAYIWLAPANIPDLVKAVWVDRILLIDESE